MVYLHRLFYFVLYFGFYLLCCGASLAAEYSKTLRISAPKAGAYIRANGSLVCAKLVFEDAYWRTKHKNYQMHISVNGIDYVRQPSSEVCGLAVQRGNNNMVAKLVAPSGKELASSTVIHFKVLKVSRLFRP